MTHHFENYLNVKALIEAEDPPWILELGAGSGQNTRNLLDTGRKVVVITDGTLPDGWESEVVLGNLMWVRGVSYTEIPILMTSDLAWQNRTGRDDFGVISWMPPFTIEAVPFCVLDTDHNGWTLRREMEELEKVMAPGGILCLHDTETFRKTNGYAMSYICGAPYHQEILDCPLLYGEAWRRPGWEIVRETKESCGAVALRWNDGA